MSERIDELANRFLAWKLPQSVCADLCVTDRDCRYQRFGTNVLTATEARQMLEHVLSEQKCQLRSLLDEAVRMIEGYKRAGWLTNPAAIEQAGDFISRASDNEGEQRNG